MKTISAAIALALLAAVPTPSIASPKTAVFINASDIKWMDAPPDFPKGGKIAVLHGDPSKTGTFSLRFKMPDGYKIPGHWHTLDEQLTILQGTFVLYMGDNYSVTPHLLEPGAYHFLPGKMHHAAIARGETILQCDGQGPFDIHYLNPADNPNRTTASKGR